MIDQDTARTARAIVHLIDVHAPGRWDPQGTHAQVMKLLAAGTRVDAIVSAACAAADDPTARTPAAMTWDQYRPPKRRKVTGPPCGSCSLPEDQCRDLAAKTGDPHHFELPKPDGPPVAVRHVRRVDQA